MARVTLTLVALFGTVVVGGCGRQDVGPRFRGRIVSHVDGHGSGTGVESDIDREGSMTSGFDYGDAAQPDWASDIKWRFLRHEGGSDVYRIDWTFRPENGTGETQTREVSFDGKQGVRACGNQWQAISIEPTSTQGDSQPAAATDG